MAHEKRAHTKFVCPRGIDVEAKFLSEFFVAIAKICREKKEFLAIAKKEWNETNCEVELNWGENMRDVI